MHRLTLQLGLGLRIVTVGTASWRVNWAKLEVSATGRGPRLEGYEDPIRGDSTGRGVA
jgi:hypothetical protein